jgi:starvation-inducible DNA-binding protein
MDAQELGFSTAEVLGVTGVSARMRTRHVGYEHSSLADQCPSCEVVDVSSPTLARRVRHDGRFFCAWARWLRRCVHMHASHLEGEIVALPNEELNPHTRGRGSKRRLRMSTAVKCRSPLGVIATWSSLGPNAANEISDALTTLLADVFTLYLKTKNFHWHMSGRHFRDYHLMLDEQADEMIAMTDMIAERARKIGGRAIGSIGEVVRRQRLRDCNTDEVSAREMLTELYGDNILLLGFLRETHALCDRHEDVASESVLENWIDETERRVWFLYEATRD